ncbi:unnamed protein product [Aspergillus oryzae]|nr:unnamed protein product [Aspergillus oryzae]
MEGLKFTGDTPPNETNSPVDTITIDAVQRTNSATNPPGDSHPPDLHHPARSERDAHADPDQTGQTTTATDADADTDDSSRDRQTRTDRKAPKLVEFTDSRLLDLWLEPGTSGRLEYSAGSTPSPTQLKTERLTSRRAFGKVVSSPNPYDGVSAAGSQRWSAKALTESGAWPNGPGTAEPGPQTRSQP